jgi:hypothetical protein
MLGVTGVCALIKQLKHSTTPALAAIGVDTPALPHDLLRIVGADEERHDPLILLNHRFCSGLTQRADIADPTQLTGIKKIRHALAASGCGIAIIPQGH